MLFAGKNRQKPEQTREERSLYPILHVAGSLKEYQKELVQKEVASLWELSLVGTSFSSVLKEADHFQAKLQDLGASFSAEGGGPLPGQAAGPGGLLLQHQPDGGAVYPGARRDRPVRLRGPGSDGGSGEHLHAGAALLR